MITDKGEIEMENEFDSTMNYDNYKDLEMDEFTKGLEKQKSMITDKDWKEELKEHCWSAKVGNTNEMTKKEFIQAIKADRQQFREMIEELRKSFNIKIYSADKTDDAISKSIAENYLNEFTIELLNKLQELK